MAGPAGPWIVVDASFVASTTDCSLGAGGALIGGQWATDLNVAAPKSPYLAFIVGLHVATALALLLLFWRDWVELIGAVICSIRHRRVSTPAEKTV